MNLELHTNRLRLTPHSSDDIDITLELFTDPDVTKYADGVMSEEDIRRDMPQWAKRGGNGCVGIWTISDLNSSEKLGTIALLPIPIEEDDTDFNLVIPGEMPDGEIEVGYFFKPSAWGMGFATEACRRILRFAFEESPLDVVVATFDDPNLASKHVLEKAGFTDRGRMLCYGEDGPIYRITREEWTELENLA